MEFFFENLLFIFAHLVLALTILPMLTRFMKNERVIKRILVTAGVIDIILGFVFGVLFIAHGDIYTQSRILLFVCFITFFAMGYMTLEIRSAFCEYLVSKDNFEADKRTYG